VSGSSSPPRRQNSIISHLRDGRYWFGFLTVRKVLMLEAPLFDQCPQIVGTKRVLSGVGTPGGEEHPYHRFAVLRLTYRFVNLYSFGPRFAAIVSPCALHRMGKLRYCQAIIRG